MRCIKVVLVLMGILLQQEVFAPSVKNVLYICSPAVIVSDISLYRQKIKILYAIMDTEEPKTRLQAIIAYKREGALGKLQVRPIMVKEVNRIVGWNKYRHTDAKDSTKSVEMFFIYQNFYNPKWNPQRAAYLWIGGSNYRNATKTQWQKINRYWYKVKSKIR